MFLRDAQLIRVWREDCIEFRFLASAQVRIPLLCVTCRAAAVPAARSSDACRPRCPGRIAAATRRVLLPPPGNDEWIDHQSELQSFGVRGLVLACGRVDFPPRTRHLEPWPRNLKHRSVPLDHHSLDAIEFGDNRDGFLVRRRGPIGAYDWCAELGEVEAGKKHGGDPPGLRGRPEGVSGRGVGLGGWWRSRMPRLGWRSRGLHRSCSTFAECIVRKSLSYFCRPFLRYRIITHPAATAAAQETEPAWGFRGRRWSRSRVRAALRPCFIDVAHRLLDVAAIDRD